jgi:chorismate synthase
MGSNSFGNVFKVTTWGESHGKAIGVVIDGCPAGIEIDEQEINRELALRAPGKNCYTTPRRESDKAEILSGVFEGQTTGAPIAMLIANSDADSSKYEQTRDLLKPGHANYTYLQKYGIFDYRGGGRASARETACRVAAGAIAKKILARHGICVLAYLEQVNRIRCTDPYLAVTKEQIIASPLFCPNPSTEQAMAHLIDQAKAEGDSLGGVVLFLAKGVPPGLGDPVYEKLEANLAKAMLSIPAAKGFEIGSGFHSSLMKGSECNDQFILDDSSISTKTNHAGGVLGGISTGMPVYGRVAFKPTSSISKSQSTLNTSGHPATFNLPEGSRHDPCVAIRAVPVVEAMLAITLLDALMMNLHNSIKSQNSTNL